MNNGWLVAMKVKRMSHKYINIKGQIWISRNGVTNHYYDEMVVLVYMKVGQSQEWYGVCETNVD
jgi:hypothetical protein